MKHDEIVLVADFGGGTSDFTILKLTQKEFQPGDVLSVGGVPLAGDALDGALMQERVAKHFGSEVSYQVPMSSNILSMPKGLMGCLYSTAHIAFLNSRENRDFLRQVESWALKNEDKKVMSQLQILLENQLGFSIFEAIEKAKKEISLKEKTFIHFEYPGVSIKEALTQKNF